MQEALQKAREQGKTDLPAIVDPEAGGLPAEEEAKEPTKKSKPKRDRKSKNLKVETLKIF